MGQACHSKINKNIKKYEINPALSETNSIKPSPSLMKIEQGIIGNKTTEIN